MDFNAVALKNGLVKLTRIKPSYTDFCNQYIHTEVFTKPVSVELLNELSQYLLNPSCTVDILLCFRPIILEILYRMQSPASDLNKHQKICVALGKLVESHPDVLSYALKYFQSHPSPFDVNGFPPKESPSKRRCVEKYVCDGTISELDIVYCCYTFLKYANDFLREKWNWADFITQYIEKRSPPSLQKWLAIQCLGIVTGMSSEALQKVMVVQLQEKNPELYNIPFLKYCDELKVEQYFEELGEIDTDYEFLNQISDHVVYVSGVLLPIYDRKLVGTSSIVTVDSTSNNLKKIALAIAVGKPVYIHGSVGCGKTALIEHLATITGRKLGHSFIKVQLGDQTDSKMLLGTYRCTDIPGEFVWQPGVLTQAVIGGHWILLEDIDSASMDVITTITTLLENNTLSIPGFRDAVKCAPGFQLFLTQRIFISTTGFYQKHTHSTSDIEKKVSNVQMESLNTNELIEIVKKLFPKLTTIADRIVDVYLLFSSDIVNYETNEFSKSKVLRGRLVSTRDLTKFCVRAIVDYDVSSRDAALKVFQDAYDVFCCSLHDANARRDFSHEIAAKLGIVDTQADHMCSIKKPEVMLTKHSFKAGRVTFERKKKNVHLTTPSDTKFSITHSSACLLERVACCIKYKEPVLLVGETGVGKTAVIQYLAHTLQQKLIVINMNQQSDSADLLGGYKPVDLKFVIEPIRNEFESKFRSFFDISANLKFLEHISKCFTAGKYKLLMKLMLHSHAAAVKRLKMEIQNSRRECAQGSVLTELEKTAQMEKILEEWLILGTKLLKLSTQVDLQAAIAFAFIEGSLVKAIQNGYWVLLDEINLAAAETLECLSGLLEGITGSVSLHERGDTIPIKRHENFTLFACMNPATDVGKKDLPAGLRNRFTEFFVPELTSTQDLLHLVQVYLRDLSLPNQKLDAIVSFYLEIRRHARKTLTDGTGHAPHFSLRTLCRALSVASRNPCGSIQRSLYEALSLSFLTQLDAQSHPVVEQQIARAVCGTGNIKALIKHDIPQPASTNGQKYILFEGYWVTQGSIEPQIPTEYILTKSVRQNLKDLVRVVSIGKHPILLQGDTSVGKTSLITYLAKASGNKCVRINNHEHVDLQEYVGSYTADATGSLIYRNGILVDAMKNGDWIILDELNLAPSDVLEALNRVLDDNRELFIPETQEIVKAHANFMLFATQNPPGQYGGRKVLSRAFRNRFVELHFDEIPPSELETILEHRCKIPQSYCKKIMAVMTDLQLRRRSSATFAGKKGFITLRDLFRWGERYQLSNISTQKFYDWDQHIADEGYLLLAGKVRVQSECNEIAQSIKKHIKRQICEEKLFTLNSSTSSVTRPILEKIQANAANSPHIVWTFNMRKLAVMVSKALEFKEPVLLVGFTGGGKTTVCQLLADIHKQEMYTVNCHMHTESSDFVGGLRPVRDHSGDDNNLRLFEWVDGPLINAMIEGGLFLADEISLADDSVLERMNSLLEPERTLFLAEKGSINLSENHIVAEKNFNFVSTMNPGGDFGKKELSPALRNRFTEIWCDTTRIRDDWISIIESSLNVSTHKSLFVRAPGIGVAMMELLEYCEKLELGGRFNVSVRDILTWVKFINTCVEKLKIPVGVAYFQGAIMTFIDGLGCSLSGYISERKLQVERNRIFNYIQSQMGCPSYQENPLLPRLTNTSFGIAPFYIERGTNQIVPTTSEFSIIPTRWNALRLLRAMQLNKAILLEGSPGVGKTSMVLTLARASGHSVVRINLSDQTDVSDLFGSDYPMEGGQNGEFAWRDGPFLRALKLGHWILLDELNLASQSVLEGLNACLDHRGEIYIPELCKTFKVKQGTRLFACQNPYREGGSRKGLPQSFLNRFTLVYFSRFRDADMISVAKKVYGLPDAILQDMSQFNTAVRQITIEKRQSSFKGGPWEFNLRDIMRWCEGLSKLDNEERDYCDKNWKDIIQSTVDKDKVDDVIEGLIQKRAKDKAAKAREVRRLLAKHYSAHAETERINRQSAYENALLNNSNEDLSILTDMETDTQNLADDYHSDNEEKDLSPAKLVTLIYCDRFRAAKDRNIVEVLFRNIFHKRFYPVPVHNPLIHVTHEYVYIGDIKFRRYQRDANGKSVSWHDVEVNVLKQQHLGDLLLRNQQHILKSLLICVKLNWMAILVGPSGCGKSCMVRTLANLTGRELKTLSVNSSMDTTEILGGFEQTDYNRHLEEIAAKIYRLLLAAIQNCLATDNTTDKTIKLFQYWDEYENISQEGTDDQIGKAEVNHFIKKLCHLKKTLQLINEYVTVSKSEYADLLEQTEVLLRRVETEDNLHSGGKFEWVDSTLVKCVQEGSWLLIDNANLCSAAVLDRLNELLEPGGSLTIGERGVDKNNELITIKPHPEFRLFLAMDPKYGEISWAMRNRGVEIFIQKKKYESAQLTWKSMLYHVGLTRSDFQDLVVEVHVALRKLIVGERPTETVLVHAGFMISQQIRRGFPMQETLFSVLNDLYVKPYNFRQPDVPEKVLELIKYAISFRLTSQRHELFLESEHLSLNSMQLQSSPSFEIARHHAVLLTACLMKIGDIPNAHIPIIGGFRELITPESEPHYEFGENVRLNFWKNIHIEQIWPHVLAFYFQMSEINHWDMRIEYIRYLVTKLGKQATHNKELFETTLDIINAVHANLQIFLSSESMTNVRLNPSNAAKLNDTPIDLKWLRELIKNFFIRPSRAIFHSNSISLFLHYQVIRALHKKPSKNSVIEYSRELNDVDAQRRDPLKNQVIVNLDKLITAFDAFMLSCCEYPHLRLKKNDYAELYISLQSFFRLDLLSLEELYHRQENSQLMQYEKVFDMTLVEDITMHYRWFLKSTMYCILHMFTDSAFKSEAFMRLHSIIKATNGSLAEQTSPFSKIRKHFLKRQGTPVLCTSAQELAVVRKFTDMSNLLTVDNQIRNKNANILLFRERTWFSVSPNTITTKSELISLFTTYLLHSRYDSFRVQGTETRLEVTEGIHDNNYIDDQGKVLLMKNIPLLEYILMVSLYSCLKCINEDSVMRLDGYNLTNSAKLISDVHIATPALQAHLLAFKKCQIDLKQPPRNLHQLQVEIFDFFEISAAFIPHNYIDLPYKNEDVDRLSPLCPVLTYLLVNMLNTPSRHGETTEQPTLQDAAAKMDYLTGVKSVVWDNTCAVYSNDFDYILNLIDYASRNYTAFLKSLMVAMERSEDVPVLNTYLTMRAVTDLSVEFLRQQSVTRPNDKQLAEDIDTICCILEECIATIKELIRISTEFKTRLHQLRCGNVFNLLNESNKVITLTARISIGVSYIRLFIACKIPPIDPVKKQKYKLDYYLQDHQEAKDVLEAYRMQEYSLHGNVQHPMYRHFMNELKDLNTLGKNLNRNIPYRPPTTTYQDINEDVTYFFNTRLNKQVIGTVESDLNTAVQMLMKNTSIDIDFCEEALANSKNWLLTMFTFKSQLAKIHGYADILGPIMAGLSGYGFGLGQLNALLEKLIKRYLIRCDYNQFDTAQLATLVRFPNFGYCQENYTEWTRQVKYILNPNDDDDATEIEESFRLVKCNLLDIWNLFVIHKRCQHNSLWSHLLQRFKFIAALWTTYENEKKKLKEEEESLYKTITRENITEKQEMELEFQSLFADIFEQDFREFQEPTLEEEPPKLPIIQPKVEDICRNYISENDIKFICDIHSKIMLQCTHSEWLRPAARDIQPNYILPFMQKHKTFSMLFNKTVHGLDYSMDKLLLPSLNVMVNITRMIDDPDSELNEADIIPGAKLDRAAYDFYHDSNVVESSQCLLHIRTLLEKTDVLLKLWPDNPTLLTIVTVCERIKNFEMKSPLSRFLVGLEVLLGKCNEWEQNAHEDVTIADFIRVLTQQIIRWRSLELKEWRNGLDAVEYRLCTKAKKWWFHIYAVMEQFITNTEENDNEPGDLITCLQQFIEKSPLGEFAVRHEFLYIFHCHSIHLKPNPKTEMFKCITWNLYQYYSQFKNSVEDRKRDVRNPIDKKIKDFVKISKWNDISYWAIKQAIQKTHRTLHQYLKEFENALKEEVSSCFVNSRLPDTQIKLGIWDRPQRNIPTSHQYLLDTSSFIHSPLKQNVKSKKCKSSYEVQTIPLAKHCNLDAINRFPHYFGNTRRMAKQIICGTKHSTLIHNLDHFTGDIIQTANNLRNTVIDTTLTQPKQKSVAKNILQQKRKALSDLFKNLKTLGVSYQMGLLEAQMNDFKVNGLLLKPINLEASFAHLKKLKCDGQLYAIWSDCESYYLRSVARFEGVQKALQRPSSQLGTQNIERIKGCSIHLMSMLQKLKASIIKSTRNLYYLRNHAMELNNIFANVYFDVLKNSSQEIDTVTEFFVNLQRLSHQIRWFLKSVPNDEADCSLALDLHLRPMLTSKTGTTYASVIKSLDYFEKASESVLEYLDKNENVAVNTEYEEHTFKQYISEETIIEFSMELTDLLPFVKSILNDLENQRYGDPICTEIHSLVDEIEKRRTSIDVLHDKLKELQFAGKDRRRPFDTKQTLTADGKDFSDQFGKYIIDMLFSVQKLFVKYVEKSENIKAEDEADASILEENHLKHGLIESIEQDMDLFQIHKLLSYLRKLTENYKRLGADWQLCGESFKSTLPLLEQLLMLNQFFVTQQISTYRTTCKMTSVLYNIFMELCEKGFCIPDDLCGDDMEAESETGASGLGLGDGTGEKDVSDRIESEDQLEDAKKQEEYDKDKHADESCKEEKGGIEMSDDFDGELQDVEKDPEEQDEDKDEDDSDAEKQMGKTESDENTLDQQIWNDDADDEPDEEDKSDAEGNDGRGEDDEQGETNDGNDNQGQTEGPNKLGAKVGSDDEKSDEQQENDNPKDTEEKSKEINELNEPEFDEDQINPHHGKNNPPPEPEAFDLPEDMQLDGEQKNEEETEDENPFDIDSMKEKLPTEDMKDTDDVESTNEEKVEDELKGEDQEDEDSEEQIKFQQDPANSDEEPTNETPEDEVPGLNEDTKTEDKTKPPDTTESEAPANDKPSGEDQIQGMDVEQMVESNDNVKTVTEQESNNTRPESDVNNDESTEDKAGVGQAQSEQQDQGFQSEMKTSKDSTKSSNTEDIKKTEKRHNPGETDSERSLGLNTEPVRKRLKVSERQNETNALVDSDDENQKDDPPEEIISEHYQHVKDSKQHDSQIIDAATKEQAEQQTVSNEEDKEAEELDNSDVEMVDDKEQEIPDADKLDTLAAEKTKANKEKSKPEGTKSDELHHDMEMEIEGDNVKTLTVDRGIESSFHTQHSTEMLVSAPRSILTEEQIQLRTELESKLSSWNEIPSNDEAEETWQMYSTLTSSLAHELSEQLRLILEPTQISRLKGDYRTGRRINMRKVIPYIASQFRKDKIWLRRTKPAKREYQIIIAMDDSQSMADNHSKELAFESLSLLSSALTLLESGQLCVLSFGEEINILHSLETHFNDASGAQILQRFQFNQQKTCLAKLLNFACDMYNFCQTSSKASNARLLVIVSDGRGVYSEGINLIKQAIRRATQENIFTVFVIIDDPKNKDSVLDIRMPQFLDGKLTTIQTYLENFPFPFYIILRDINQLPIVLSDALRQWFELVADAV